MTQVLDGIRVVEFATFVFGPAAGTVMSDFGAEVIHVEHPTTGDPYRYLQHLKPLPECNSNYPWILDARNKKSIALDLKQPDGHEVAMDLVRDADVLITNFHPSVLESLSLRYEDLAPLNEKLVYAHATGFGDRGADAEKPGYDATAWWASSGLMNDVRPGGGELAIATPGMGDHPSAMSVFGAIMLALFDRERTGRGRKVSTSLLANGIWSNSIYVQAALCGAPPYMPPTHAESPNALLNPYATSDGRSFYLAMVNETGEWERLTEAIGRPDLRADQRFTVLETRRANAPALTAILDEVFGEKTLADWRERLDRFEVTFGVVARSQDLPDDPQLEAIDALRPIQGGAFRTVDSPIQLDGVKKRAPGPAPEIGQHSVAVLESLGYPPARIDELRRNGVIRTAD